MIARFILGLMAACALHAGVSHAQSQPAESLPAADNSVPDTLMFTIDEYNDIQSRLAGAGSIDEEARFSAIEDATLYLSSILYFDEKDWTIWVNGVPIGPDQDFSSFQVTSISSDYVELLVPLSAQGMRPIRLSPNQTFITRSGIVVEGQARE